MDICVACSAEVPDGSTICPACGAPSASGEPTVCDLPTAAFGEQTPPVFRSERRFAHGTVLASRYRVIAPLGRGGMGEVYRVDDLKLNQAVALKFISPARAFEAVEEARLRQEVRLARQISHPNVCRVFDLGEVDGQSFLCMEFIDGEDLAGLLRRLGRLPVDQALDIARQLAAGLAAIHDGGLLHRDLKPANVVIDGRGRVRIADFGLLVHAAEVDRGRRAGTPAYMAPEQLLGSEASVQSDLYALGLIVHEMLAGRPAGPEEKTPEAPVLPESVTAGIDTRIRTTLQSCLERSPGDRPASALQVAAAWTGEDPLAFAVTHGLTLSPEAIAAAERAGRLRPVAAVSLLAVTLGCLAALIFLAGRIQAFRQIRPELPPDRLAARARSYLLEIAPGLMVHDKVFGLLLDPAWNHYLSTDLSRDAARRLLATARPPLYRLWYRTSPGLLLPKNLGVTPADPPRSTPGETYLELDLAGRLHHLEIVPGGAPTAGGASQMDWGHLLAATGLDAAHLKAVPPLRAPPVFADRRGAWEGSYPGAPPLPVHIETASFQGTPVWLDVTGPWSRYSDVPAGDEASNSASGHVFMAFRTAEILAGIFLAWRNLRLGRGDVQGTFRLAILTFSLSFLFLLAGNHSIPQLETNLSRPLGESLVSGFLVWAFYLGFEPSARRLWPERIVSWNRLLAGRFLDPLVGRDLLIGCLFGLGKALLQNAKELPSQLVFERGWGDVSMSDFLLHPVWGLPTLFVGCLFMTLQLMLLLWGFRVLLRKERLAPVIPWILLTWGMAAPGPYNGLNLVCSGLGSLLVVAAYTRFGVLAGFSLWFTYYLCALYPLTLDTSAWYASSGLFAVLVLVVLTLYGFATSIAGQRWFAHSGALDD